MKKFTPDQKKQIAQVLAEIEARGLAIPEEIRLSILQPKKVINWPINKYGCFTNRFGRSFIPNEKQKPFIESTAVFFCSNIW